MAMKMKMKMKMGHGKATVGAARGWNGCSRHNGRTGRGGRVHKKATLAHDAVERVCNNVASFLLSVVANGR